MSLAEKIKELADKIEVNVHDVERYIHQHIDELLGFAQDNTLAAKDVVVGDIKAAEHNVGDVIENSAAAMSNEAAEEQKQIDGVVHAVEGEPAATSATPNPAPLPPATPDAQA